MGKFWRNKTSVNGLSEQIGVKMVNGFLFTKFIFFPFQNFPVCSISLIDFIN